MKALRVTLIVIISFILVNLILGLTVATSLKEVVQNELIGEVAKQAIISESEGEIDTEIIDNILSYKGTNEVIDSVINDYVNYLDSNKEVSDKTIDLIINFLTDNKEELEKITGEEIDISEINSSEVRENLKSSINQGFNEINIDNDSPVKTVITTYGKITSNSFKTTILLTIIVLAIILVLLSWSLYKWLKPLGIVLTTSGSIVIVIYLLSFMLSSILKQSMQAEININTTFILISGICETLVGIILLVVYSVINKKNFRQVYIQN